MDRCTRAGASGYAAAFCVAAMLLTVGSSWAFQASPAFLEQVGSHIRGRMAPQEGATFRSGPIHSIRLMPLLYKERRFEPLWLDTDGLRPAAQALIRTIENAGQEGLLPSDYHLEAIRSVLAEWNAGIPAAAAERPAVWAECDLLLSDAFLLLSSHVSGGRVNPETLHKDWVLSADRIDFAKVLRTAASEGQMERLLEIFAPTHRGYRELRGALVQLRAVSEKGGWPPVPAGPTLRPEDSDPRVGLLRERLTAGGELPPTASEVPEHFDAALSAAVARFQKRHGLDPDGTVGKRTLAELNVTCSERVRQIELNMERWRWLPDDLGRRRIEVNTADFSLSVVEDRRTVLRMRVVVGRPARRTPVFSAPLSYLVVNPEWTVPHTIAVEDILPRLVENVGYLGQQSIKVYPGWDDTIPPIDPHTVDWRAYGKRNFPFRLVQEPGPSNSLGQIKFMFPNRFSIYLHDTPNRKLFGKVQRDYSSGCIRVEDAPALAAYLLKEDPYWSSERFGAVLKSGRQQVIHIKNSLPVHLLYMTAWVDERGELQFRRDIYERDLALDKGLRSRRLTFSPAVEAGLSEGLRLKI